ncbi:MAG: NAD(+) diphosphatase [Treponema sp.]|jgi:NAD+ diphosphatase|nr:NAD(+) diphosphatase [Treponema sp.]
MDNRAFFFQDDKLLLPEDFPDSQMDMGISRELANDFNDDEPDTFEIQAIEIPSCAITGVSVSSGVALPAGWKAIPVRQVLAMLSSGMAEGRGGLGRLLRAFHIAQWRRNSRFCGSCGAKNKDVCGEPQRLCPVCGRHEFPRISPAVIIVIIDDDDRILLAHNKKFKAGVYSHISGFNEAGETLETTAIREIREEVNIEVQDLRYLRSQPWPFPNSLMLGFSARYLSGDIRVDGVEIEDARWFTKDNLPELPGEGSLSRFLIGQWLNGTLVSQCG